MVGGPGLLAVVGLGAVGGILANIALTPLTAGAALLQSYWYGSGLILGERMMYTVHWEQIKARLDKGESFMNVLDAEMNKDITAIAELSFKAMDETGKLYLEKAGTTLAAFIERLLINALDPFGDTPAPGDDVVPPGEDTPEGIVLTIDQIEGMSIQALFFETQPNQITKYTEVTQAHMLTILARRKLEEEQLNQDEADLTQLKFDLLQAETLFLQELATFQDRPIEDIYGQFITKFPSNDQTIIIAHLKLYNIYTVFGTRVRSATSDIELKKMTDALNAHRQSNPSTLIQQKINALHITIVLWQKIYSR